MEVGILSMRYAKAIIEYAQEKGLEDKVISGVPDAVLLFL